MDNDSNSKIKSNSKIEFNNKQCWICLQTEYKDEINPISGKPDLVDPNEKWLTPCCCKGSTQYVHEECLINWIKLKRDMDQKSKLCCPSCQTPYTILIPQKTLLQRLCISAVNKSNKLLQYIPIIVKYICIAFCIWKFSYYYGKFTLTSIFEKEYLDNNLKNDEIKNIIYRCFPFSLIGMLFIPWEFSFLISASIIHLTLDKEVMITMILLYAVSCDFFSYSIRLVLDYIYNLKLNFGLKNDEKTREQRRLLKLSKSVTFPNARVHINENFISPSSFTLKIHIFEDIPNIQANPQILYVEYEKAIILLAVIKSKILHFLLNKTNHDNVNNVERQQVNNNNNVVVNNNNNDINNDNDVNNDNNNQLNRNNNNNNNNDNHNHNNNNNVVDGNNNVNININNLNNNLNISTVNLNVNNTNNNVQNAENNARRLNNVNEENSRNKNHKKCQSLPHFLNKNFLNDKAFSCIDLTHNNTNNNCDKYSLLDSNKSMSINNFNSFKYMLNSPRSRKYSNMHDSSIDYKLKNSLNNIILSNKENNFMKILNKQKSLYTKLTTNENMKQYNSNVKQKNIAKSSSDESLTSITHSQFSPLSPLSPLTPLSPRRIKKMKNIEAELSNDMLNKPSSSSTSNYSNKKLSSSLKRKSDLQIQEHQNVNNVINNDTNINNRETNSINNNINYKADNNNNNNNNNNINNHEANNNNNNNINVNNDANINDNDINNAQNNLNNIQNVNNRRTKEAYLTINITNVNNHVKTLILKTLSLPIIALMIGRLIHWSFLIIQLLLSYVHLYPNIETNTILNDFKTNPLIYTAIGIVIANSFHDLCQIYYNYSKNIEKEKLVVLNHQDITKKLNNYTSINN